MIRTLLLLLLLTYSYHLKAQNCTVAQFTTQASIDNFKTQNPGCTKIDNLVEINGDDIVNLNGLSGVTYLGYRLNIINCPLLTDISGLSSVTEIIGEINIESNPKLENLIGLEGLTYTNYNLRIVYNLSLNSISSLSGLTLVKGFLSIGGNPALTSFSGLENLTTINGAFSSTLNDNLVDITGLSNLEYIGDFFNLISNPKLENLTALNKLTKVLGYINIGNCASLTSLSGMDNIDPVEIDYVVITGSPLLSVCGVASICKLLAQRNDAGKFAENAPGCSSLSEVIQSSTCVALPVTWVSFSGKNTPEGNLLEWQTSSELNNAGFAVESSLNAKIFNEIGFVEGYGTVTSTKNYAFTESMPQGLTYYRLKQSDFDKSVSYSKIIAVKKENPAKAVQKVTIYPNPARGELTIKAVDKDQNYSIKTLSGTIIKEEAYLPAKPIDTSKFQDGLYLISVGNDVFKVMITN